MTLEQHLEALKAAHRFQVRKLILVRSLWLMVLAGLVFLYTDLFFQLGDPTRLSLDVLFVAALLAVAILTRHWLTRATSEARRVARLIEEGNPDLRNDLVNAIDFRETLERGAPQPVSTELMQQQIGLATERARAVKRLDSLKPPSLRLEARVLLGSVAVACLLALVFMGHFSAVVPRYLDPFGDHPPYSPTQLSLDPAGATVDYGQSLKIGARAAGPKPTSVSLVLLDKNIPGSKSDEVIRLLRSEPGCDGVPILILSGERLTKSEVAALGANDAVQKPFDVAALVQQIRRYV